MTDKKVKLTLVGIDGNVFFLMGAFRHQASKEGWAEEEIDVVIKDAMSGDYDHLLTVLTSHCEEGGF